MFETTPPPSASHGIDPADLVDLSDPVAAVVAVELTRRFIQLCLHQTEPFVTRLARRETTLRQPGGIELEKRTIAQRLYRAIDPEVFALMPPCVPLANASVVLSGIEVMLREQFADVAGTAASYLLSDGREAAIQMAAVATTMAAREVRRGVIDIIGQNREADGVVTDPDEDP